MREGINPVEHRRAESIARKRAAEGAFHLVAQRWLDFKRKEWVDETYRKAEFVVREYLTPAFRNKPISTLATPEVEPVLEAIASHAPNFVTKARQYVGGIVRYAVQNGLRDDGTALTLRGVVPRHKKGHIPAITKPADIAPLVCAIDAYKSPITREASIGVTSDLVAPVGMRGGAGAHPLVARDTLVQQDLTGENFITYPPVEGVYFYGLITGVSHEMGVTVAHTQHLTQTYSILALVGAGLGVGLVPQSAERVGLPDLVFKPLAGLDEVTADLLLAGRTQTDNPVMAAHTPS